MLLCRDTAVCKEWMLTGDVWCCSALGRTGLPQMCLCFVGKEQGLLVKGCWAGAWGSHLFSWQFVLPAESLSPFGGVGWSVLFLLCCWHLAVPLGASAVPSVTVPSLPEGLLWPRVHHQQPQVCSARGTQEPPHPGEAGLGQGELLLLPCTQSLAQELQERRQGWGEQAVKSQELQDAVLQGSRVWLCPQFAVWGRSSLPGNSCSAQDPPCSPEPLVEQPCVPLCRPCTTVESPPSPPPSLRSSPTTPS